MKQKRQLCQQLTNLIIIINYNTKRMKHWNHQLPSFDDSKFNNVNDNVIIIMDKQALTAIDAEKEGNDIQRI